MRRDYCNGLHRFAALARRCLSQESQSMTVSYSGAERVLVSVHKKPSSSA